MKREAGKLDLQSELETSSMLLAPTLEAHQEKYARLFAPGDKVLDVGAGDFSFVRKLQSLGFVAAGCSGQVAVPSGFEYNTLNFSESIGYLSELDLRALILPAVRKIIIKDFYVLPGFPTLAEETSYDFGFLRDVAFPVMICSRFRVEMGEFRPDRTRWVELLEKHGITYVQYPHFRTVIVRAVRDEQVSIAL